jgi:hypothetical protein
MTTKSMQSQHLNKPRSRKWMWVLFATAILIGGCSSTPTTESSSIASNVRVVRLGRDGHSTLQGQPEVTRRRSVTTLHTSSVDPFISVRMTSETSPHHDRDIWLLFDSGAEGFLHLSDSARAKWPQEDVWISQHGSIRAMTIDGERRSRAGAIRSLRIGDTELHGVPTTFGQYGLSEINYIGLSTIVSLGTTTFDWSNNLLLLNHSLEMNDSTSVPLSWWTPPAAGSVRRDLPGASITTTILIGSAHFEAIVDTGATATLTIPKSKAILPSLSGHIEKVPHHHLPTRFRTTIDHVALNCEVSIGGHSISVGPDDLVVVFDDSKIPPEFEPPLVLGTRALRQFSSTTFDFTTDPPRLILVR